MLNMKTIPEKHKVEIDKAIRLLKDAGCSEVYLFGSIVDGRANENSDIDLAAKGCPPGRFFAILGRLMVELECPVDLVNLDGNDLFSEYLQKEGELIHVS